MTRTRIRGEQGHHAGGRSTFARTTVQIRMATHRRPGQPAALVDQQQQLRRRARARLGRLPALLPAPPVRGATCNACVTLLRSDRGPDAINATVEVVGKQSVHPKKRGARACARTQGNTCSGAGHRWGGWRGSRKSEPGNEGQGPLRKTWAVVPDQRDGRQVEWTGSHHLFGCEVGHSTGPSPPPPAPARTPVCQQGCVARRQLHATRSGLP